METKVQTIIKDIIKRRIQGVNLDGTFSPIKYHVAQNTFYVAMSGKIKAYRRNALVALLLEEAKRLERYSRLLSEEAKLIRKTNQKKVLSLRKTRLNSLANCLMFLTQT